ncbi:hypothetical protein ACU8OS_35195 (plasmid) [Rhizobium leguminosarum]
MTMLSISAAKIEAIQAIVDGARATGHIDYTELKSTAEIIRRHDWMQTAAAYLATKNVTPAEQAQIDDCMFSKSWAAERNLSALVDTYKRGDLKQMIDVLDELPALSKLERRVVKSAAKEFSRGFIPITEDRMKRMEAMMQRHGIQIELGTLKIGDFS